MRRGLVIVVGLVVTAVVAWLSWPDAPERSEAPPRIESPAAAPAPATTRLPDSPAPAPPSAPAVDVDDGERLEPDEREQHIREALAETFGGRFADRSLSDVELEQMADALQRMVAAREQLRQLTGAPDEGGLRKQLIEEIGEAVAEFEQIADAPLSEVTRETGAGGLSGADEFDDEVVFEPIVDVEP